MAELLLDAQFDFVWPPTVVTGLDALAQRIRIAANSARGEWWIDRGWGVAYREVWLGKRVDPRLVETDIRRVMLAVPGVRRVRDVVVAIDGASRRLTASWVVEAETGVVLQVSTDPGAEVELGAELMALLFSSPEGPVGGGLSPLP
jgi:hypothetical protein